MRQPFAVWVCVLYVAASAAAQGASAQRRPAVPEAEAHPKALKAYREGVQAVFEGDQRGGIRLFEAALKREPDFAEALVELAGVHYDRGEFAAAETYLERVAALSGEAAARALYGLAMAEYKQEKYEEASVHLRGYLELDDLRPARRSAAEGYLANAEFRARALAEPVAFDLQRLPPTVNTPEAEYLPSLTADANQLVFTRRRGGRDEDFYVSERTDSTDWGPAEPLVGVNTLDNEGAQTVSADGRYLVFTACNRKDGLGGCDLYSSRLRDGRWSEPTNLGAPVNTSAWESMPSLAANGEYLFFASKRPGGHGGADLYASGWNAARRRWGEPVNLGPLVNTARDEQAPYWHADGRTLYFMSDGHPGMGGFDLYVTRVDSSGTWAPPANLGYPLNTANNEGALAVAADGATAYYATDAQAAGGADSIGVGGARAGATDLYTFTLPPAARAGAVTYVRARVSDAATGLPLAAGVTLSEAASGKPLLRRRARGEDGSFLAVLPAGTDYAFAVAEEGYGFYSDRFAVPAGSSALEPYELDIRLQPLPRPMAADSAESDPIVLHNVLFATGEDDLLPASRPELARLRDLLTEHPDLRIRIQGHTDNVGTPAANLDLSERRAARVVDYLVGEGVDPQRLTAAGFGESRPVASNDTPEGRALNRRTEFVMR